MAVHFETTTIVFNPERDVTGRRSDTVTVRFGRTLFRADVALQGFRLRFDNGDHHVLEQEITLRVERVVDDAVTLSAQVGLRDANGYDDPFSGFVQVLVIAETVD